MVIAATSTGDFVWALAFFVWGALAHLRDRPVAAGVLFALAIGTRLSSVFLLARLPGGRRLGPAAAARCLRTALVAVPLGLLLYVPPWLAYDRSAEILETAEGWRSFANNLGRFAYKNYATAGALFLAVVLVATPALIAALRRWGHDPMLRLGVLGFAVTQGAVLRAPVEVQPPAAVPGHAAAVAGGQPPQRAPVPVARHRRRWRSTGS